MNKHKSTSLKVNASPNKFFKFRVLHVQGSSCYVSSRSLTFSFDLLLPLTGSVVL